MCYDAKFGRKKVAENGDDAAGKAVSNGNGNSVTVAIVSNGNKRASEMAVYEQFRGEVLCFFLLNWSLHFTPSIFADSCFIMLCVSGAESDSHKWLCADHCG